MEPGDFQSIASDYDGQKVFSTPRYLDSPLIADHLLPDMNRINSSSYTDSATAHLRKMIGQAVRMLNDPELTVRFDNKRLNVSSKYAAISPSNIITLATMTDVKSSHTKKASACWHEMGNIVVEMLRVRGLDVSLTGKISQDSVEFFEREEALIAPQSKLVALRAAGDTTLVVEELKSPLSSHIILSDMYSILIHDRNKTIVVGTYNMFLSTLDIVRSRARTSLAIDLNYSDSSIRARVYKQWAWQEFWIRKYENEGFALAKTTEALNKTRLGWATDPETRVGGAYENMWIKIYDKIFKLEKSAQSTKKVIAEARTAYESYVTGASEQELTELFGLQKSCGYPFIDSVRSGLSALKEAELHIATTYVNAYRLRNAFRALFLTGYLAKEHKWPAVTFSTEGHATALYRFYTSRYTNLQVEDLNLDDMSHITFLKNFEFDMHENYLELMDDKALSFSRDEADAYWDKSINAKTDRRLLLEIMSREKFSYRAILKQVNKSGVPHSWRIVCLYPKEKEMKADARMFAMMVLEMRTLFNGSEANLAKQIFPYISTQTMTKSKEEIHSMFRDFTKPREDNENQHLFLECDLSRWNLRWRGRTVNLVGSDLNNLFGVVDLFTLAHVFFNSSIIVVRTPRLRPEGIELYEPPAGPLVYRTWLGGVEGIWQKLWSLCTYAMICTALHRRGLSYILIGQGDNQILSIVAPRDDSKSLARQYMELNEDITRRLEQACAAVGQELKPEECLQSRSVITYSKEVWVRGVMRPLTLKYFSRVGARTNDEVPTLCAELAGLHAAAVAAAEASFMPLTAYLGCCFLQVLEIERRVREDHPMWSNQPKSIRKRLQNLTIGDHLKILSWPSTLGGLPISTIWDYIHRGTADPLDQHLGVLFRLFKSSKYIAPLYAYYISERFLTTPESTDQLIAAPYSIPLIDYPTARAGISTMIRKYIQETATNEDLRGLLSEDQRATHSVLLTDLSTMSPMYPVIARELVDCSAGAEIDRLERMFIMTQTIQKAARSAGISVSGIINMASGDEFVSRIFGLITCSETGATLDKPLSTFTGEAKRLRMRWLAVCTGVEGVTSRSSVWSDLCVRDTPIPDSGVKVIGCLPPRSTEDNGPLPPYFGARTHVARSSFGYKIVGDSRPARAVTRLRSFANMPGIGPNLQMLISNLATRRGFDGAKLHELAGGVSSSRFDHRYHARDEERGSHVVGPYNFSTHLLFYTEEIQGVSGSANDYPIMFQEYFTDLVGSLNLQYGSSDVRVPYIEAVLLLSSDDVSELPALATDVSMPSSISLPLVNTNSRLIYDRNIRRVDLVGTVVRKGLSHSISLDDITNDTLISAALRALLVRVTPTHFTSTEIFDAMVKANKSVKIDLAELLRIGGDMIIDAASHVAALTIAERFLTEIRMGAGTGRLEVYVKRYAAFFSQQLIGLWENAQTWNDPLAQSICINHSQLRAGGVLSPVRRLQHILACRIRAILRANSIPSTWRYVFSSEGGGVMSQMALGVVGKAFIAASYRTTSWIHIVEELSRKEIYEALATSDEGYRLRRIRRVARKYSKVVWLSTDAREVFELLSNGDFFSVIDVDHVHALRLARGMSLPQFVDTRSTKTTTDLVMYKNWTCDVTPSIESRYVDQYMLLTQTSGWGLTVFRYDESFHYFNWTKILSDLKTRCGLIIGVGHGYAAKAMLENGFERVIGLDLIDQYDLRSFRSNAPPFALRQDSRNARFAWSPMMFKNSVELPLQDIIRNAVISLPEDALIVYDVQPVKTLKQLRDDISGLDLAYRLLFRRFSDLSCYLLEVQEISSLFYRPTITCIAARRSVCIYVVITTQPVFEINYPRWSLFESQQRISRLLIEMTDRGKRVLSVSMLSALGCELDYELLTPRSRQNALSLLRSMIGRRLVSDKYVQWTHTLAHMKLLEWWIEDGCSLEFIPKLATDGQTTIRDLHKKEIIINISEKMVRLFVRHAASIFLYNILHNQS